MVARTKSTSGAETREHLGVSGFLRELGRQFSADDVTVLAQSVAYNLIFAIPPLLILVVTLAGILNNVFSVPVVSTLQTQIAQHAPGSAQEILKQLVDNAITKAGSGALSIGLIVSLALALYGASGGIASLVYAFNKAYGVKDRRRTLQKLRSRLGLTLLFGLGMVLAFVLLAFGGRIGQLIADRAGLGNLFKVVWSLVSLPFAAVVVVLLLAAIYYFGPYVGMSFRWALPGAVVAAVLWIATILGFRLYLALSNPGSAYGAAAGAIVFLFLLYVTGIIFIIGAEVNAIIQPLRDPRFRAQVQPPPVETLAPAPAVPQAVPEPAAPRRRLPFDHREQRAAAPVLANGLTAAPMSSAPPRRRMADIIAGVGIVAALVGSAVIGRLQRKTR